MHIVNICLLDNCLDRSVVKEFHLSDPVCEQVMERIARIGRLQYFPDFPRPYFRIDRSCAYVVQGVFGNTSVRVTFSPLAETGVEDELRDLIEKPLPDECP